MKGASLVATHALCILAGYGLTRLVQDARWQAELHRLYRTLNT